MWFLLSLLTAFVTASVDAWSKRFFGQLGLRAMAVAPLVYSLPLLVLTTFFIQKPTIDKRFYISIMTGLPINIISYFLYMKAVLISPLSLSLPFLAFTPVFMIFTGHLVLGEKPNIFGVVGIILVVVGAYVLNISPNMKDPFLPIKSFFREKGSVLMAIVSILFSFGAVIGKLGIMASSPLYFSCTFFIVQNILILLFTYKQHKVIREVPRVHLKLTVVGIFYFCHILFHNYAISMIEASYMIAVKRLSILFGMVYGALLFREKNLRFRVLGGLLMVGGAAIIAIGHTL